MKSNIIRRIEFFQLVLFSIIIIAGFVFSFRITEVPPGINGDEAAIGYNALLVAETFRDENNRFLPLFILTLDGKDWKQPVTFYSTVLLFKIFGPSFELLRGVSVLYVLVSGILLFFLVKLILNFKAAIISTLLFLTTPIVMIQSHLALENIAPLPFIIFWLLMIAKFDQLNQNKYLVFAGISLGVSFYSYYGMRLVMPVLLTISICYLVWKFFENKQKVLNSVLGLVLGVLPFILILPWVQIKYAGAIFGNASSVTITNYQDFISPYLSSFDPSFLFIKGDATPYHSTGLHGMFLLATLPVFLLGIYQIIKKKQPLLLLILAMFFMAPILYGFVGSIHRASRLMVLVPAYSIITTVGFWYMLKQSSKIKYTACLLFFLITINYIDFLYDYWNKYPSRVVDNFTLIRHQAFHDLYLQSKIYNLNPYIQTGIYQKSAIAAKFYNQLYFSGNVGTVESVDQLPENGIILSDISLDHLKNREDVVIIETNQENYNLIRKR